MGRLGCKFDGLLRVHGQEHYVPQRADELVFQATTRPLAAGERVGTIRLWLRLYLEHVPVLVE